MSPATAARDVCALSVYRLYISRSAVPYPWAQSAIGREKNLHRFRAHVPSQCPVTFIGSETLLAALPRKPHMDLWNHQSTRANIDGAESVVSDQKRLAAHIADGHLPFPAGLDCEQIESLALLVRNRRREQLVRFLARQIAIYFAHGDEIKPESRKDVKD